MEAMLQSLPPDFWAVNIADVVSLLLTLGLFWVYLSMRDIQDEQNTIQENQNQLMQRQTALMAANHQPRLHIHNYSGGDNSLAVWLHNKGEGPAKHLHTQCVIYKHVETDDGSDIRPAYRGVGTVVGSVMNRMGKVKRGEELDGPPAGDKDSDSTIEAGETTVAFKSQVQLKPHSAGSEPYEAPFSDVMQRLSPEWKDIEHIAIDLFVLYTDVVGEVYFLNVGSHEKIPLHQNLTLEEAIKEGEPRNPIGEPISEDNSKPMIPFDPESGEIG